MDSKKFGKLVYDLRIKHKMTQKELGDKLFVSDKTISKWECGNGLPDITLLMPLANIFNITVSELIKGELDSTKKVTTEEINYKIKEAIDYKNKYDKRKRKIYRIIKTLLIVILLYITIFIIDYVSVIINFQKPIFAMNSFNHRMYTDEFDYYEKNYDGLGYNYYTRGQIEDGEYSVDYVELSIFGHSVSKHAKGVY